MKLLFTIPHDTLLAPQGARARIDDIFEYFTDHEISILAPHSTPEKDLTALKKYPVYFFNEPGVGKFKIPYLLDYSSAYGKIAQKLCKEHAYDFVISHFPWGITQLYSRLSVPVIYVAHGLEKEFAEITLDKIGAENSFLRTFFKSFISRIEKNAVISSNKIICMSDRDKNEIVKNYSIHSSKLISVPPKIKYKNRTLDKKVLRVKLGLPVDKSILMFHGSANHLPNEEAVQYLVRTLSPLLPGDVILLILGGNYLFESSKRILNVGFVEDLDEYLQVCDFGLIPIFKGSGVRMKYFDFARWKIPVIATKKGIEGIEYVDRDDIFVSDNTYDKYAEKVIEVLKKSLNITFAGIHNTRPELNASQLLKFLQSTSI